ncbi:MAG: hypothetical protein GC151_19860 [Betaproteobacteria bacterium]|nr:hypothetical protein [Betaproteobacteria bacterium]
MAQIEDSLKELDRWYGELPGGTDRPKFLAKLATLELCGWLEHRLDSMVQAAGTLAGLDPEWVVSNVLKDNHGFTYQDHLRKMLSKVVGESGIAHLEFTFEQSSPGKLEQLKGALTTLWKSRGLLAHTHTGAPVVQQQTVNAPSWTINQQRIIGKMLDQLEASVVVAFARTIAKP